MDAALAAKLLLGVLGDHRREFNFLAMQILAGDLRQAIELFLHGIVQTRVGVTEVDRRVPHLQVEKLPTLTIINIRAFAALKHLWRVGVVDGVTMRTVLRLKRKQFVFGHW